MTSTLHNLHEHAILASLSISQWSGRKYDKGASVDVNSQNGAEQGAARVNKRLLAKDALAKITKIASQARDYHESHTLPWRKGISMISVQSYQDYRDAMGRFRAEFNQAATDFSRGYDQLRDDAKSILGNLFSVDDYPCATKIRDRFEFEFDFLPVPHEGDFRVSLRDDYLAEVREDVRASTMRATNQAILAVYERATLVLDAMASKLAAYVPAQGETKAQGIFRDSLVENVRDMAKMLPGLNVFGDPAIGKLAERMLKIASADPSDLRESDALRKATADSARALVADIEQATSDYL